VALAYGADSPVVAAGQVAAVQSLSGTGSCRLFAEFQRRFLPNSTVYIPVVRRRAWQSVCAAGSNSGWPAESTASCLVVHVESAACVPWRIRACTALVRWRACSPAATTLRPPPAHVGQPPQHLAGRGRAAEDVQVRRDAAAGAPGRVRCLRRLPSACAVAVSAWWCVEHTPHLHAVRAHASRRHYKPESRGLDFEGLLEDMQV
jgi:hypothetical protein